MTAFNVAAKALNGKTDRSVCLRVKPNKTSQSIRRLTAGDQLQVIAVGKTWDKVVDLTTGQTGNVARRLHDPRVRRKILKETQERTTLARKELKVSRREETGGSTPEGSTAETL